MIKPNLRFKEFSHDWENVKLGDIATKVSTKNTNYEVITVLTNSAVNGIVYQNDFFTKSIANSININSYYIVNVNDFVYNPRISKHAPVGAININRKNTGIVSPLYTVFRFKKGINTDFFEYVFKTSYYYNYIRRISNIGARHDRMNILDKDFFNLKLNIPTLAEQEKIGKFLTLIDKRINLLTTQKSKLEDYKKTLSTKLLTQEIRFKGFSDDWQTVNLGDIVHIKSCSSKSKYMENNGMYSIIDMGAINHNGKILPHKKTNHNKDILNINNLVMVKDDIGKGYIIGKVCFIPYANKFICGDHVYKLSIDDLTKYYPLYLFYSINSNNTHKEIRRKANGTAQIGISLDTVKNIQIQIPTIAEQEKIARVLSNIDKLIERKQTSLTQTITYKKYLLQNMFV